MSTDVLATSRFWFECVLARLGIPDSERQECIAGASVALAGVVITFLQPAYAEGNCVVARAVVGEVPPEGQCESFFKLVLEVQAMLCGPHAPVLGLDWPARMLLISCSLDVSSLSVDDAAGVLRSMHQMAMEWREAIAQAGRASAICTPRAVGCA